MAPAPRSCRRLLGAPVAAAVHVRRVWRTARAEARSAAASASVREIGDSSGSGLTLPSGRVARSRAAMEVRRRWPAARPTVPELRTANSAPMPAVRRRHEPRGSCARKESCATPRASADGGVLAPSSAAIVATPLAANDCASSEPFKSPPSSSASEQGRAAAEATSRWPALYMR